MIASSNIMLKWLLTLKPDFIKKMLLSMDTITIMADKNHRTFEVLFTLDSQSKLTSLTLVSFEALRDDN